MTPPVIYVVDDDAAVRDSLLLLLESFGFSAEAFESASAFLAVARGDTPGCLVLDVHMHGMDGLQLQNELAGHGALLPIIFLTGHGDVPTTVRAMKAGAVDFLTKPVDGKLLLERIEAAVITSERAHKRRARLATLTQREREVLDRAVAGYTNKEIARALGISYRTVEVHRSRVLSKTGAATLLELAHLVGVAQTAETSEPGERRQSDSDAPARSGDHSL